MRVYDPTHPEADATGFRFFRKSYGRSLKNRNAVIDALRTFFSASSPPAASNKNSKNNSNKDQESNDESAVSESDPDKTTESNTSRIETLRIKAIQNVLVQLRPLRRWFDENQSLRFYASSLLIVYEGDVLTNSGNGGVATVKMIDFGRVRRVSEGDPGYTLGLRNLRNYLTSILEEEEMRLADSNANTNKNSSSNNNSSHR
jgi:hypothetical protein